MFGSALKKKKKENMATEFGFPNCKMLKYNKCSYCNYAFVKSTYKMVICFSSARKAAKNILNDTDFFFF